MAKKSNIKYSTKYLNAVIWDAGGNEHLVVVKNIFDNHFVTEINNQYYCFRIVDKEIKTVAEIVTGTLYRKIYYDVGHYMPLSSNNESLKLFLKENELPKLDRPLFNALYVIGKSKTGNISKSEPFQFKELIEQLSTNKSLKKNEKYNEYLQNTKDYLLSLNIEQIVTPIAPITDYIHETLIATNPGAIGSVLQQAINTDNVRKVVMNRPVKAKKSLVTIIAVVAALGGVGFGIYAANDAGWFEDPFGGLSGFSPTGKAGYDSASLQSRYPNGAALAEAVDRGDLNYDDLPKDIKKMVDLERERKNTP